MINKKIYIFFFILFFSCHHIQDTKYKEIFNKNVTEEIKKTKEIEIPLEKKETAKTDGIKKESKSINQNKKKKVKIREVTIKADTMFFEKETTKIIFEKNVKIFAEDISLYADKLESYDYKNEAIAEGNIKVYYKKNNIKLNSEKIIYKNNLEIIIAENNVMVEKLLDDGNTLTMWADIIEFNSKTKEIIASKKQKRVKIKLKDMTAYADKIRYDEEKKELIMEGKPLVKKKTSFFLSKIIVFDIDKKKIQLKGNIRSKLFYEEFEKEAKYLKKIQ